jgi:hypothetical protein
LEDVERLLERCPRGRLALRTTEDPALDQERAAEIEWLRHRGVEVDRLLEGGERGGRVTLGCEHEPPAARRGRERPWSIPSLCLSLEPVQQRTGPVEIPGEHERFHLIRDVWEGTGLLEAHIAGEPLERLEPAFRGLEAPGPEWGAFAVLRLRPSCRRSWS